MNILVVLVNFLVILIQICYAKNYKLPFNFEDKTSIAVFDIYSNEIVFHHNERELLIPASTMKLVTSITAISLMSPFYYFEVKLMKKNNELLITSNYNPSLIEEIIPDPYNFIKQGIKNIIEANSIYNIEKVYIDLSMPCEFPKSWEIYRGEPFAPLLSTFSFNQNMIKIQKKQNHFIIYPPIFDELKDYKKISNMISNLREIDGAYWYIYPSPEEYNIKVIKKIFNELGFDPKVEIKNKININDYENLGSFPTATLLDTIKYQNYWSDNYVSQQIFNKLNYEIGVSLNSLYREFNVVIDDGCGLSRKNRISSYFLAYLLSKLDDYNIIHYLIYTLPGYNQGTLEKRNLPLTIKAKTGTLNDVSSLAGFLKTNRNKWYSFAIIYNGPNVYNAKIQEERILNYIYNNW